MFVPVKLPKTLIVLALSPEDAEIPEVRQGFFSKFVFFLNQGSCLMFRQQISKGKELFLVNVLPFS